MLVASMYSSISAGSIQLKLAIFKLGTLVTRIYIQLYEDREKLTPFNTCYVMYYSEAIIKNEVVAATVVVLTKSTCFKSTFHNFCFR